MSLMQSGFQIPTPKLCYLFNGGWSQEGGSLTEYECTADKSRGGRLRGWDLYTFDTNYLSCCAGFDFIQPMSP